MLDSSVIKNKFAKIKDSYEDYLKGADLAWTPNNDLEELIKLDDVQEDVMFFIEGSYRLAENHKNIRKNGVHYKELMNEYKKFIRHTDLDWGIGADVKQLDSILNIQNKTLEFISKRDTITLKHAHSVRASNEEYPKIEKAYSKYIKKVDISWTPDVCIEKLDTIIYTQNQTLEFINLRNTIEESHKEILKESMVYRHIRKCYEAYIGKADVSWTPEVDLNKLKEIIALQDSCKALLQRSDIKQINKAARKSRMSDLKEIVE